MRGYVRNARIMIMTMLIMCILKTRETMPIMCYVACGVKI